MKITDNSLALGNGHSILEEHPDGSCIKGVVCTPNGLVKIYAARPCVYRGRKLAGFLSMLMTFAGRLYTRSIDKCYSARGIVTQAKRFAAEISNGKKP